MSGWRAWTCTLAACLLLCVAAARGETAFPPHRVADTLYYVGGSDDAVYLLHTSAGEILIDTGRASSLPMVERNMEQAGFHLRDVRIVLISHAHWDHCANAAAILRRTHAQYMVMDGDVAVVESGGRADFAFGADRGSYFPAAKVDRVLHDGDHVALGGVDLVAHKTAGHTRGDTTWSVRLPDRGRMRDVVIVGGMSVLSEYKLVGNARYPEIADDFRRGFATLRSLPCEIFLGAHGKFYGMAAKYRAQQGGNADAFVDPAGYRAYIDAAQASFEQQLQAQQSRH